jgi:cardiolipin synthase
MKKTISVFVFFLFTLVFLCFLKIYGSESFVSRSVSKDLSPVFQSVQMDQITSSKISKHNKFVLLNNDGTQYEKKFRLIENAKKTINLATYYITDDSIGRELIALLLKKARQGVKIKIIVDQFAMKLMKGIHLNKELIHGNIKIKYYSKGPSQYHAKALIVDGREAVVGGRNWSVSYKTWRDADVIALGPIVKDIQLHFEKDWLALTEKLTLVKQQAKLRMLLKDKNLFPKIRPFKNGITARYIYQSPDRDNLSRTITDYYLYLFQRSKKNIFLSTIYFEPQTDILNSLVQARQRGVEISIFQNSLKSASYLPGKGLFGSLYKTGVKDYPKLINLGFVFYEWDYQDTLKGAFHSKLMVIDDYIISIGAYNIDKFSYYWDYDNTIVIYSKKLAQKARNVLIRDQKICLKRTKENTKYDESG